MTKKKSTKKPNKSQKRNKLTSFGFTTTKPVRRKQRPPILNFQGFPMDNCVYHRSLDGHYYAPPKYYKTPLTEDDIDLSFCHECLLQPCMMVGTEEEVDVIIEKVLDLKVENRNVDENDAAMRCIKIIHKNIFPNEWGSRAWPPPCIKRHLPYFFQEAKESRKTKQQVFPKHP